MPFSFSCFIVCGLDTTNIHRANNTIMPQALSAIFSIPLIAMVRFDYGTKRKMTGLFSTQITDEEFLRNGQGSAPYYGVPALLMGGIVSLVSFSIAANCITAAYFYVFLEGGGTNEISMACYLQWYTNGSL